MPVINITLTTRRDRSWQNANLWHYLTTNKGVVRRFHRLVVSDPSSECLRFIGPTNGRGYGQFSYHKSRIRAHRFAWLLTHGSIPAGYEVCHRCDVPSCVNPAHLFLGTRQDNHLDSVRKGRKRAWGLQKLNAAQVLEIRARVATGELHKHVAHDYGIARHTVSQIINRKTWAHLSEASHISAQLPQPEQPESPWGAVAPQPSQPGVIRCASAWGGVHGETSIAAKRCAVHVQEFRKGVANVCV